MKPRLSIPHAEFRGKTTARPCDINAHVAGTTTINIEILSDTSKLLRNEPPYLQGMETYILYASNVIFPHFRREHSNHISSATPPAFCLSPAGFPGADVCTAAVLMERRGTTRRSTTQTQPHTHTLTH